MPFAAVYHHNVSGLQLLEVRVVDAIGRAVIAFLKKAHHSARLGIAHILQPALPQAAGNKGCAFSAVFIKFCFICRPRNGFRRIIGILCICGRRQECKDHDQHQEK